MKKKILFIILWLVIVGIIVMIIPKNDTKTAWRYLDRIVELRTEKQYLLNQIKELDTQIIEYREIMDSLQFSWLDYLGLTQEQETPQRTWTEAPELTWSIIE